ncbi:MAG: nucleoside deaminase [bacterium]|nr:nucleoside deaminase [bacterium]
MSNRPIPDYMRRAAELAEQAVRDGTGGPFGAVIVHGEAIVAEGHNRVLSTNDPTAHAEVEAIRTASAHLGRFDLSGCELYTSCEPCPMCLAAAFWARLDRVWFAATRADAAAAGFDDARFYEEIAKPSDERDLPVEPFLRESALDAFRSWNALEQRRVY